MIMPIDKPEEALPQPVLDALNRQLAISMDARNAEPDPEMGGLSPNQVTRLIYTEWGRPGAAVQFNTDVPLAELEKAECFREARTLLKALHAAGEVRATTSKNLPRKFVADVLPLMCDEKALDEIHKYNKVVNEQDVPPLHYARVVAQAAGLARIRKGKFSVPASKCALLRDDRAGALFRCLFIAFFRKFNLAYTHRVVFEARGLQTCVAYTLYRLGVVATEWKPVDDLPDDTLLPAVREEIEIELDGRDYWTPEKLLSGRLIRWFIEWGLLEGRYQQEGRYLKRLEAVRTTPLYTAVLHFRLDPPDMEAPA